MAQVKPHNVYTDDRQKRRTVRQRNLRTRSSAVYPLVGNVIVLEYHTTTYRISLPDTLAFIIFQSDGDGEVHTVVLTVAEIEAMLAEVNN